MTWLDGGRKSHPVFRRLGSNVTLEHWLDLSLPNLIQWLPGLGPRAGKNLQIGEQTGDGEDGA